MKKITKYRLYPLLFFIISLYTYLILLLKIPCPIKKHFHIECPSCGITRMFISLFKLDFYQAFRYNALVFFLLIIIIIYIIYILICKLLKKRYYKIKNKDLIILFTLIIIYTIIRNIPGFDYFKPTNIR